jgi:hypothetical protein
VLFVWIALAIGLLAFAGGAAVATRRGLDAYRTLKTTGRELTDGVDRVSRDADALAAKLERLADGTGRLEHALTRLRESRARLNVLLHAIAEVRAAFGRITGVVPRKG